MTATPKKLVLVVIDAMKPEMLERAIASGRAPALERITQEGVYVPECVAAFPSVTPVCAASITTGVGPHAHGIPSMNWYHRDEQRYIEYGSSFSASRQFGVLRSLTDTVYRMNAEHLSRDVETVFESLDEFITTMCSAKLSINSSPMSSTFSVCSDFPSHSFLASTIRSGAWSMMSSTIGFRPMCGKIRGCIFGIHPVCRSWRNPNAKPSK